jgi:putative (di)nucleoside polyphosphate hydrolase
MTPSVGQTDPLPYRPCVGLCLLNGRGEVFVGRRKQEAGPEHVDATHAWQMPQGGIDPGEDPYAAALRELYEETNVRSVELVAEAPDWFSYDLPGAITRKAWRGRYRGQTQKWFALRFTGEESEIDIHHPGEGRHKPEFDAWRWERMDRLPDLVIPFKRGVYEKVIAAFAPFARPPA